MSNPLLDILSLPPSKSTPFSTTGVTGKMFTPSSSSFSKSPFGEDYDGGDAEFMKIREEELKRKILKEEEEKRKAEEEKSKAEEARLKAIQQKMEEQAKPFKEQMQGQKVALLQQAGQGLEAQKAMQNPNYQLGSGSALRQRRGEIAPDWARMNRAARRLERKGYREQAGQMFAAAEIERVNSPSIVSQDQRNRMQFMDMELDAKNFDAKKNQDLYDQYMKRKQQREMARFDSMPI